MIDIQLIAETPWKTPEIYHVLLNFFEVKVQVFA